VRHPHCVDRITSIDKIQSNKSINIYIAKRCFYIASRNNGNTGQPIHCDTTKNQRCQTGISPVWHHTPTPLPPSQITHPTFYTVNIFYLRITFNSTATVVILNANFIDVHEISLRKTNNIVYCMVCFKNERMYNLMMADTAAEICR